MQLIYLIFFKQEFIISSLGLNYVVHTGQTVQDS